MNIIARAVHFLLKPFHRLNKRLFPETDINLTQLSETLERLTEENCRLREQVNEIHRIQQHNSERTDIFQKNIEVVSENVRNINAMLDGYDKVILNLQNLNTETARLTADHDRLSFMLNRISRGSANETLPAAAPAAGKECAGSDSYSAVDYFDFENYFRGSRELIKKRQAEYLAYFKGCKRVLDIGCGRGEFLELMQENNIPAVGVDTYSPFADYCKEKGLTALCAEGIAYLSEEQGFDGIFAGQVIEHLTLGQIVSLIDTAYDKLPEGGVLIMETPNPQSLSIYVNAFYLDPSHVKPVHPETMRYLLKNAGFRNVEIVYTENSRPDITIPPIKGEDEFNQAMSRVSEMLFGSQDYAVIARK